MASKPTIQKGSYTITNSQASSWTIARGVQSGFDTTVDATKTILLVSYDGSVAGVPSKLRWQLTDGETITIDRGTSGVGTNLTCIINWTLISFSSGVTVQHKTATIASGSSSNTVAITEAGIGGRFIIANGAGLAGSPSVGEWTSRWLFNTDTEIAVSRSSTSANALITACQVVEWNNATVQSISMTSETWATTTLDKTITSVDTSKTLIFGSGFLTTNGPADMNVTFSLPNTTTLRLNRTGATSRIYNATIYVVEVDSGISVQYIDTTLSAVTTNTTSISTVVEEDTVLHTTSLQNNWPSGNTSETDIRRWLGRSELTNATTLTLTRNNGTGDIIYTTQVVEFLPSEVNTQPSANSRIPTSRMTIGTVGSRIIVTR